VLHDGRLQAEADQAAAHGAGVEQVLRAGPVVGRGHAAAAERRAEVDQVVAHVGAAVLGHQRVERVDRLGVHVIEPRGKHAVAAQLAAILVRHDVVRVVGARAEEADPAHGLAFERLARHHADAAVGSRSTPPAARESPRRIARLRPLFGVKVAVDRWSAARAHVGHVVLGHVVAERPHQLRHRHLGAGGHAAVAARIELEEPLVASPSSTVKPGVTPSLFDE
jgi:hypothetical protein